MVRGTSAQGKTTADTAPVPAQLLQFVGALFLPTDTVLLRPIETWAEGGRKQSKVIYASVQYQTAEGLVRPAVWDKLTQAAAREHANLYFGVCPRFGAQGYDLAWQIRTVRVLWSDLDHCTLEESLRRCQSGGLPRPSVIIGSGHGIHFYWLLETPLLIDDVGDPLAVHKEWLDQGPGEKKKSRLHVKPDGHTKVYQYLSETTRTPNTEFPTISPKGVHCQHVLAGIAAKVDGDHTQDLSRMLRLPGTLNRKDERNGKPPVKCELVECDPTRRYPFADFERFAEAAPQKIRADKVARVQLPRRKLTPGRRNRLVEYINTSAAADVGHRSEADFALVCFAIGQGLDREAVWGEVQGVGKFAEGGRGYFDRTWDAAEGKVRERLYQQAESSSAARAGGPSMNGDGSGPPGAAPSGDDASGEAFARLEDVDDPDRLARAYLREKATGPDGPLLRFHRQGFLDYVGTHWRAAPDVEVRARLARFAKARIDREHAVRAARSLGEKGAGPTPKVTVTLVSNVLQALGSHVIVPERVPTGVWLDANPAPRNYLAFGNGLLDLDAFFAGGRTPLLSHTCRWFSPVLLPYEFDAEADCPKWLAFLGRNLDGDAAKARLLQEFAGYLLSGDTTMQKFLMLVGEGANGKSVACSALSAMLGEGNVSAVPLELFGQRFQLTATLGKLANIVNEVGELDKVAEGQVKAFVTGDSMLFEGKFKAPFSARPTARLVLATNNPPRFNDKSDGIWRRTLLLRFPVQIPVDERSPGMDKVDFWQASGELPGMVNWALAGLHLLRQARQFTEPADSRAGLEQLRRESSSARHYLAEHYQAGPGEVKSKEIYTAYRDWAQETGHKPVADETFGKELLRLFPKAKKARHGPRNARYGVYVNVEPRVDDDEAEAQPVS
jgi:P4 family phage/plasmid primase-like protien